MREQHFIAREIPGGYTFTLPGRAAQILRDVQARFGDRDRRYTLTGIEFSPDLRQPQIWYPYNSEYVVIQLTEDALHDEAVAAYQLAHECVHLLSPSGSKRAPIIEEGLAASFAQEFVLREFGRPIHAGVAEYEAAVLVTRELLALDADAILKIREIQPAFVKMTQLDIENAVPAIDPSLARRLVLPFHGTSTWDILGVPFPG